MSRTYAVLDVSARTFREIQNKLASAGYVHAFKEDDDGSLIIDLHGVAIRDEEEAVEAPYEALTPTPCPRRRRRES